MRTVVSPFALLLRYYGRAASHTPVRSAHRLPALVLTRSPARVRTRSTGEGPSHWCSRGQPQALRTSLVTCVSIDGIGTAQTPFERTRYVVCTPTNNLRPTRSAHLDGRCGRVRNDEPSRVKLGPDVRPDHCSRA